jgi:hypothetical protein
VNIRSCKAILLESLTFLVAMKLSRLTAGGGLLIAIGLTTSGCFTFGGSRALEEKVDNDLRELTSDADKRHVDLSDWLSQFQEYQIRELPILPGTHNSGSAHPMKRSDGPGFQMVRQQEISILDQLKSGVRLLDFRIRYISSNPVSKIKGFLSLDDVTWGNEANHIVLAHTFELSYTLAAALREVSVFFHEHPTEFVAIMMRPDWEYETNFAKANQKAKRVQDLLDILKASNLAFAGSAHVSAETTVGDVKGRVLLISEWLHENPDGGKDLFDGSKIDYLPWRTTYKICDTWNDPSGEASARKVDNFMKQLGWFNGNPESMKTTHGGGKCIAIPGSAIFTGIGLDRTEAPIPPCIKSPQWIRWFTKELNTNPEWRPSKELAATERQGHKSVYTPIGVVLFDFANPMAVKRLIDIGLEMAGKADIKATFPEPWFRSLDLKCYYRK